MRARSYTYTIIIFIYVLAIPFYGSYLIPMVKTVVFLPLLAILIFDNISRYFPFFKFAVIKWFVFYISFSLFTCLFVKDVGIAFLQLLDFLIELVFLVTFVIISSSSKLMLRPVSYALVLGLALSILLGYFQHFYGLNAFKIQSDEAINININENSISRVGGPFGNSLTYSNHLSVVGIMVCVFLLTYRSLKYTILSILTFSLTIVALVLSGGRVGIVSFFLSYLIAFFIQTKNKFFVIASFFVMSVAIGVYSHEILNIPTVSRFFSMNADFKSGRLDNWAYAMDIIGGSPFIGTGIGNLNLNLTELGDHNIPTIMKFSYNGHLESVYVTILATTGIIGFLIFFIWIIIITNKMVRSLSTFKETPFYNYSISCFYGWVVFLINMLTDPAFIFDFRIIFLFLTIASSPYIYKSYFTELKVNITNG